MIAIKNMEMPSKCPTCFAWIPVVMNVDDEPVDYCSAANRKIPDFCFKPDWCPLVEIDEGGEDGRNHK